MRPLRLSLLLGLAVMIALGAAGCSPKKVILGNRAPSTRLFVQYDGTNGDPHTVPNSVHLYWFGSDPDGFVARYEYRFIFFPGGDPAPAWSRTQRTDSLFNVPDSVLVNGSDTAFVSPVFEVRAVDNEGLADPNPPQQRFDLRNQAPLATFIDRPDTTARNYTLLTQSLSWSGVDPDGDAALLSYRVWLDGHTAAPHLVHTNSITFPTSDFVETAGPNAGTYQTRVRTAYVQAIDPGGLAGKVDSVKWTVRAPVSAPGQKAKLLLVDDTPFVPGNPHDQFWYTNATGRTQSMIPRLGLAGGAWALLKMEAAQNDNARPFRSVNDLRQTLALFDAVVWYHGQDFIGDRDTVLTNQIDAVKNYVDAGGKIYVEGSFLVDDPQSGTLGLVPLSFVQSHVDADFLFRWYSNDSTANWSVSTQYVDPDGTHPAILHSSVYAESLKVSASLQGVRVFGIRDTSNVVLWARTRTIVPRNDFDAPVAIRSATGRPGMVVLNSTPMLRLIGYDAGSPTDLLASPARVVRKIMQSFGVVP